MTLTYVKGNILNAHTEAIAHGVAVRDIEDMATGLAKQIKEKWPQSFSRFKIARRPNSFQPGEVLIDEENQPKIAYLATQPDLYRANLVYVNRALRNLRKQLETKKINSCALPKIGCGFGKLDWEEVKLILEERLSDSGVQFEVYEEFIS